MSASQLIEKAQGQSQDEAPRSRKKNTSWEEVETFEHAPTGLAVVVTKRTRGPAAYSFAVVQIERRKNNENGFHNRFIKHPSGKDWYEANPEVNVSDVVRALVQQAKQFIDEELRKQPKRPRHGKKRRRQQGGLSDLARQDAENKGYDYEGKTARKRKKGRR